jgi:hypothetical protein
LEDALPTNYVASICRLAMDKWRLADAGTFEESGS